MKFIKNKMKFVFWAILVSFAFSISNICAMKRRHPKDVHHGITWMETPQVTEEDAKMEEPADFPVTDVAKSSSVSATPLKSVQRGQGVPQSSAKATIDITNYCRQIIETLNNKVRNDRGQIVKIDLTDDQITIKVLEILNSFYKKIPSTLKNSTRKRTKGQSDAAFELQLRKDALNYHKSLFLCLAMCLKMSVSTNVVSSTEDLTAGVEALDDYRKISLKVNTDRNKIFSITFNISETFDEGSVSPGLTEINEDHEWNKKYKVNVGIEILSLKSIADVGAIDISKGYETENFFKSTTTALVPFSSDSRVMSTFQPFDFSDEAAASAPAEAQTDEGLQDRLGLIFNAIPPEHRVYLEQYYQFLMFSLVNFMGSCLCFAEFITGDGRADLIIRTEREGELVGSIIELKRAQTADVALVQIDDREYINSFDGEFQIVGISISGRDSKSVVVKCKKKVISPREASVKDSSLQIISHIPKPESKIQKAKVAVQKAKVAFDDATRMQTQAQRAYRIAFAAKDVKKAKGLTAKAAAKKAVENAKASLDKAEKALERAEKKI
ncbi:MAG: hypothetical protein V1646_01255 [bacterium]